MTVPASPSIDSTNQPPRPSMVNAPATANGSPVRTYAAISASLACAKWTVELATASARASPVDQAVSSVEVPERPRMRVPATGRLVGRGGLAEDLAVELQHRVAAQHVRRRAPLDLPGNRLGLEPGQLEADPDGCGGIHNGLVDVGRDDPRVETGRAQGLEPGRAGRGEHECRRHGITVPGAGGTLP